MKIILSAFLLASSFGTLRFCSSDNEIIDPTNVVLTEKWATEPGLKTPESALYDGSRFIYVSNINGFNNDQRDGDGFISILKKDGTIVKLDWLTGLNDPKGLALYHDKLYVADINELVEIDIHKAQVSNTYLIPEAAFLNDVTVDAKGTVYVSDTGGNKIYQLKNKTISVFADGENVNGPNGLIAEKDRLVEVSINTGEMRFFNYQTKNATLWTDGIPNADGVARDLIKNYFASNWQGEVYYVFASGNKIKILDTKEAGSNAADIGLIADENILLVPTFFNNRIVAYQIKYE